jgi:predicted nucleotidyltransferase
MLREASMPDPVLPDPVLPDPETAHAARTFLSHIADRYPVKETVLFGSRARGTHDGESDVDLAVILHGSVGKRYRIAGEMAEIAFTVMLETGILVQALPLWEDEFEQPEAFSNPGLIAAIRRDGVRL